MDSSVRGESEKLKAESAELKDENNKLKLQNQNQGQHNQGNSSNQGGPKGKGNPKGKSNMPENEYKALCEVVKNKTKGSFCLFDASSIGCKFGHDCRNVGAHGKCPQCGGNHNWAATHFRGGGFGGRRSGR